MNMAATKGTGSGTFSGVTTVNFAAQTDSKYLFRKFNSRW